MRAVALLARGAAGQYDAQALLQKAITIDPNYRQPPAFFATSRTFASTCWADVATTTPLAESTALAAVQPDSEDPSSHHVSLTLGCWRGASTNRWPAQPNISFAWLGERNADERGCRQEALSEGSSSPDWTSFLPN
jgi:hypothetical protein